MSDMEAELIAALEHGRELRAHIYTLENRIEALEADVDRFVGQRDKALEFISANAHRIEALEAALAEAQQLVTEANNSLYGSQGYFHSLNGGSFNKYHLAEGIETLKASSNRNYHRIEALEAALREIANDPDHGGHRAQVYKLIAQHALAPEPDK